MKSDLFYIFLVNIRKPSIKQGKFFLIKVFLCLRVICIEPVTRIRIG